MLFDVPTSLSVVHSTALSFEILSAHPIRSAVVSLLWMLLGTCLKSVIIDGLLSLCFLVAWVFGVAFITFGGAKAPGAVVGNLYFFTWGSFVLAIFVTGSSIGRMLDRFRGKGGEEEAEAEDKKDEAKQEAEGEENKAEGEEAA